MPSPTQTLVLRAGPPYKRGKPTGGEGMDSATALTGMVGELGKTFTGQLLQPADLGYEDARKVHNGLIDKRPALIASCHGVADIVDTIKLARDQKLEVAVR